MSSLSVASEVSRCSTGRAGAKPHAQSRARPRPSWRSYALDIRRRERAGQHRGQGQQQQRSRRCAEHRVDTSAVRGRHTGLDARRLAQTGHRRVNKALVRHTTGSQTNGALDVGPAPLRATVHSCPRLLRTPPEEGLTPAGSARRGSLAPRIDASPRLARQASDASRWLQSWASSRRRRGATC